MMVTRHRSADEFLAVAGPSLMRAEAENNLMLGIVHGIARNPAAARDPYLATVTDGPRLLACAVHIAPYKLVIGSGDRDPVSALARDAFAAALHVDAVTGPAQAAADFAQAWSALSGVDAVAGMRFRIYEIRTAPASGPASAPGAFRRASDADLDTLAPWMEAFASECRIAEPMDARQIVADAIGRGRLSVWDHGGPVSMAAWAGKTANGVRIHLVYTPPECRRRGYGTACVAALTAELLAAGSGSCWLYADEASDASAALFSQVGYRPVSDVAEYSLTRPPTAIS